MKLIDKDALIEEIEKRRDENASLAAVCEDNYLISFINNLEVKEVKEINLDFEKELYKTFGQVKDFTLGMHIAKHFFELGLKSKKELK